MYHPEAEARRFHLRDLPLVSRLKSRGISLDSETYLAHGLHTVGDAALSRVPLADLGTPTLVARAGETQVIGQLRHKQGESHAHIVFISPALSNGSSGALESAWLRLLDALAQAAGQRGAHTIHAEVDENSAVFEALRRAGYAPYAQQDIWRREPGPPPGQTPTIALCRIDEHDMPAVRHLHAQMVPQLAQQADPAPPSGGLAAYQEGRVCSYVGYTAGNRGLYLRPYLHNSAKKLARAVLETTLLLLPVSCRVPVYCSVRQYQGWLGATLEALGFEPWARQTVLVKHTVAHIQRPAFAPLPSVQGGIQISGGPSTNCQLTDMESCGAGEWATWAREDRLRVRFG